MYTSEELTPKVNIKEEVLCAFYYQVAQGKEKEEKEKKEKEKEKKKKKKKEEKHNTRKDRAELFRPKHRVKPRVLDSLEELF